MSHWYVPSAREAANRWTDDEWQRAVKLRESGLGYEGIALELGRTCKAVSAKFAKEGLTPEQRQARAAYQAKVREGRRGCIRNLGKIGASPPRIAVDDSLLRERDARLKVEPRDLTALLCGDPKPGYSALDRRQ